MHDQDIAIPQLPARVMERTPAFYRRLGFATEVVSPGGDYAIADRGCLLIHLFLHSELVPAEWAFGCYLRVSDVDTLCAEFSKAGLPAAGIPRLAAVEDKPWGMREFALVDENRAQIRVGEVL